MTHSGDDVNDASRHTPDANAQVDPQTVTGAAPPAAARLRSTARTVPPPGDGRASRWTVGSGVRASIREFFVIVAGVLAALGAQALWEGHQERELERDYLRQLAVDARENARRLNEAIAIDSSGVAAAARLMGFLERDTPGVPRDSIVQWIFTLGSAPDFQPVTGTHRALLETGDLRFVRDAQLRDALTSYATALDRGTSRLEQLRASTLAVVPDLAREIPFLRLVFSGGADLENVDVTALQRSDEAAVIIFTVQALSENRLNGLRSMRAETMELLDALGER